MILPSQLHIDWTFTAVPVWGWEPAERNAERAPAADAEPAPPGPADACGESEPPSLKLVFQGYEWRPTALWECLANPDWDRLADGGRDDAVEHARRDERNRQVAPKPPLPAPLAGGAAPTGCGD